MSKMKKKKEEPPLAPYSIKVDIEFSFAAPDEQFDSYELLYNLMAHLYFEGAKWLKDRSIVPLSEEDLREMFPEYDFEEADDPNEDEADA